MSGGGKLPNPEGMPNDEVASEGGPFLADLAKEGAISDVVDADDDGTNVRFSSSLASNLH